MKKVVLVLFAALTLLLAACTVSNDPVSSGNNNDLFKIQISTDKSSYSTDERITCYATVEYIGQGDSIAVYSIDPIVGFSLLGKNYYAGYDSDYGPITVNFKKGVPLRYALEKFSLAAGEYELTATLIYFFDNNDRQGTGHIITTSVNINVAMLSTTSIFVFAFIGLLLIILPSWFVINVRRKQTHNQQHMNDYIPSLEMSLDDTLKKMRIKPDTVITYGQNYLLFDSKKKNVFIQSPKARDGVLLNYNDIVSYEIIQDDKVIARAGSGYMLRAAEPGEDGIICSDLRLVINTSKASEPKVILPFISFSIDSQFAYKEALGAAKDAADILDEITKQG